MKKENETCIQRVKVVFPLRHYKPYRNLYSFILQRKKKKHNKREKITDSTFPILTKYTQMMELLRKTHQDWFVFRTKKKLVMETTTFDFCKVIKTLSDNGFSDTDYILEVEYERKWGML